MITLLSITFIWCLISSYKFVKFVKKNGIINSIYNFNTFYLLGVTIVICIIVTTLIFTCIKYLP